MAVSVEARIQANTKEVNDALKRFAREMGVSLKEVYMDQLRLASNQLVKLYHPKKSTQGKGRIKKELSNLFVVIGPKNLNMVKSWESSGEQPAGTMFKTSRGAVFGVEQPYWNIRGDMQQMKRHHKRHRSKATGRSSQAGSWTRNIGRWKFIDRQVVPQRAFNRYLKTVTQKVGALKGAWVPNNAPFVSKAPAWVMKGRGKAGGIVGKLSDQMNLWAKGVLSLTNPFPHADKHKELIAIAINTRRRDLERHAKKRLDPLTKRFNSRNN